MAKRIISYENAAKFLEYDPELGIIYFNQDFGKHRNRPPNKKGDIACKPVIRDKPLNGYRNRYGLTLNVNNVTYSAAKMAWYLYYNELPKTRITFLNYDPQDIRISNMECQVEREYKVILTKEIAESIYQYDPATGIIKFKQDTPFKPSGSEALTCFLKGYKAVSYKGKIYMYHRVAWLLYHGNWPKGHIDHISGDILDNRICNLRDVAQKVNSRNRKLSSNSRYGCHGISERPNGKYRARITHNGRVHYLGQYALLDDAIKARKEAEKKFGFHENHGRLIDET